MTGVPVAGAREGSKASMSKLRWIGRCVLVETVVKVSVTKKKKDRPVIPRFKVNTSPEDGQMWLP